LRRLHQATKSVINAENTRKIIEWRCVPAPVCHSSAVSAQEQLATNCSSSNRLTSVPVKRRHGQPLLLQPLPYRVAADRPPATRHCGTRANPERNGTWDSRPNGIHVLSEFSGLSPL